MRDLGDVERWYRPQIAQDRNMNLTGELRDALPRCTKRVQMHCTEEKCYVAQRVEPCQHVVVSPVDNTTLRWKSVQHADSACRDPG